jgi:glutamyl/glutaminyl-tRNA synthetase
MITRFAPSPTGYLHLGHACSAHEVWRIGREVGAQVLLRIEDVDRERCKPQFEHAIYDDLHWLGCRPSPPTALSTPAPARAARSLHMIPCWDGMATSIPAPAARAR